MFGRSLALPRESRVPHPPIHATTHGPSSHLPDRAPRCRAVAVDRRPQLRGDRQPRALGAQWSAQHGLTAAQFQSTFDNLFKQGYRLKTVSGYVTGGAERFAGLWVKQPGPAWQARVGLSAADYQKAFDDFGKQGYRLTW